MSEHFTELELNAMTFKLLMEIRIEQKRARAYSEALASVSLNENQKSDFKLEFKKRYSQYLQELSQDNPSLFDESARELLNDFLEGSDKS